MIVETLVLGFQTGFGAAVIRNLTGYIRKATEDGKITKYEVYMGVTTLVTNVVYASAFILMGMPVETAMGLSILTDIGVGAVKDMGTKK